MKDAAVRLLLLAALTSGAVWLYRTTLAPDATWLSRLAERELKDVFGPDVTTRGFAVDLVEGVDVTGLEVRTPRTPEPTLTAGRVEVDHSVLDLAAGLYRPERLRIRDADVSLHETPAGVAPDFPFRLSGRGGDRPPEVVVEGARLRVRARPGSERLAEGSVLELDDLRATVARAPGGRLEIQGSFTTRGLGQDEVRLPLTGWVDPATDALDVRVVWDPLTINPALVDALAPRIAAQLRGSPLKEGRLEVGLQRAPGGGAKPGEDEVEVGARLLAQVGSDVTTLPGLRDLPEDEKARVRELLGGGVLDLEWERGALVVRALTARFGSGTVTARGRVEDGFETLDLTANVRGLRLEDPALRRALGPTADDLFRQMEVSGTVDAEVHFTRVRGQPLAWMAKVTLIDARLLVRGNVDAEGRGDGFPYALEHAHGVVRISPRGVVVDGIEGRHGERTVMRVLSTRRPSWTGEESGYARFGEGGCALCITVEALDVPVDEDLRRAIDGSELHGLLDTFRLGGVIDRVEADVVVRPDIDPAARVEVRVTLDGETLEWAPFPVGLEEVRGVVTLRRPPLPAPGREGDPSAPAVRRGRALLVDVRASLPQEGGPASVTVLARADLEGKRGRVRVSAKDLLLDGPLGKTMPTAPLTFLGVGEAWRWLEPRGRADFEGDFPLADDPGPVLLDGHLRGVTVTVDAPAGDPRLDLEGLEGHFRAEGSRITFTDLRARLLGAALAFDGELADGLDGELWLDARSLEPIPLTPQLLERVERLAQCSVLLPAGMRLEPGGRAGLDLRISKPKGAPCVGLERLTLTDVDAAVAVEGGPTLRIRGKVFDLVGGKVRAEGLTLYANGAEVKVTDGTFGPEGLTGRFTLELEGCRIDDDILALIPESARETVLRWSKDRRLSCTRLTVDVAPDESITAHGDLTLIAEEDAPPGGAPRGRLFLENVRLGPPDALDRRTLTGAAVLERFALDEGVALTELVGRVEVARLRLGEEADGSARVLGLAGRVEDVRFKDLQAVATWADGILRLEPVTGTLAGGALAARLLVHTRAPEAYEGRLAVKGFDVAQLRDDLFPTGPAYRGTGTFEVTFSNRSAEREDLLAEGSLRVRDGHLGDLPAVANLFVALSSLLPGNTPPAFECLDAEFTFKDEVFHFHRLDLTGPMTKMPGSGTVDLTGQIDITFTPDFIKGLLLPGVSSLPVVGDVLRGVLREELIYAVRVHGDIDNPSTELILLPPLGLRRPTPFAGPPPPEPPRRRLPHSFR